MVRGLNFRKKLSHYYFIGILWKFDLNAIVDQTFIFCGLFSQNVAHVSQFSKEEYLDRHYTITVLTKFLYSIPQLRNVIHHKFASCIFMIFGWPKSTKIYDFWPRKQPKKVYFGEIWSHFSFSTSNP